MWRVFWRRRNLSRSQSVLAPEAGEQEMKRIVGVRNVRVGGTIRTVLFCIALSIPCSDMFNIMYGTLQTPPWHHQNILRRLSNPTDQLKDFQACSHHHSLLPDNIGETTCYWNSGRPGSCDYLSPAVLSAKTGPVSWYSPLRRHVPRLLLIS